MAEGTRFKEMMEVQRKQEILLMEEKALRQAAEHQIQAQFDSILTIQYGLQNSYTELVEGQKVMQQQLRDIIQQFQSYNKIKSGVGEGVVAQTDRTSSSHLPSQNDNTYAAYNCSPNHLPSIPRIEFPRFNGDEPRAWIRKCLRYFQIVNTIPEEHKVPLASVHLNGKAELWFQGFIEGKGMPTWSQFMQVIYERFDGVDPGMILGEFTKLHQQSSSVAEYLEKFEELKAHVMVYNSDFPESFYVTCFVNGLRPDIKGSVLSLKPTKLHQAITLAINQESMVEAIIKRVQALQILNQTTLTTLTNPFPFH